MQVPEELPFLESDTNVEEILIEKSKSTICSTFEKVDSHDAKWYHEYFLNSIRV